MPLNGPDDGKVVTTGWACSLCPIGCTGLGVEPPVATGADRALHVIADSTDATAIRAEGLGRGVLGRIGVANKDIRREEINWLLTFRTRNDLDPEVVQHIGALTSRKLRAVKASNC